MTAPTECGTSEPAYTCVSPRLTIECARSYNINYNSNISIHFGIHTFYNIFLNKGKLQIIRAHRASRGLVLGSLAGGAPLSVREVAGACGVSVRVAGAALCKCWERGFVLRAS